jgi:hypothetical protein
MRKKKEMKFIGGKKTFWCNFLFNLKLNYVKIILTKLTTLSFPNLLVKLGNIYFNYHISKFKKKKPLKHCSGKLASCCLISYCNKSNYITASTSGALFPYNRMTAHMGAIIVWTCLVFHVFFFLKKEIDKPKKHDAMMWKFYAGKETSGNGGLFPDF